MSTQLSVFLGLALFGCLPRYVVGSPVETTNDCVRLSGPTNTIQSHAAFGETDYGKNMNKCWHIDVAGNQQLNIDFKQFDVELYRECRYDHVTVIVGGAQRGERLCGRNVDDVTIHGPADVVITFVSDEIVEQTGFVADLSLDTELICTVVDVSGTIQSAHPYNPDTEECWILMAPEEQQVTLTFAEFDLERSTSCRWDSLDVYEGNSDTDLIGRFCASIPNPITSLGSALFVRFTSDRIEQRNGFIGHVTSGAAQLQLPAPGLNCTVLTGMGVLSSQEHTLYNEEEEEFHYLSNLNVYWLINAEPGQNAYVKFDEMKLEDFCMFDYLEIFEGVVPSREHRIKKVCKNNLSGVRSRGRQMLIRFRTDSRFNYEGFRGWYATTPRKGSDVSCGIPAVTPRSASLGRIINGRTAVPHSWPWMTYMKVRGGGVCGGSIVSENYVLTAAHCLFLDDEDDLTAANITVYLGKHHLPDMELGQQVLGVVETIPHELYVPGGRHYDIALLRLNESIIFHDYVRPVCVPHPDEPLERTGTATGWGHTGGTADNKYLQQLEVPFISQETCSQRSWYGTAMRDYMICAGYEQGRKDTCQGDSGGPLVMRNRAGVFTLRGITSWGSGCALPKKPGVYTRVTSFIDWIEDHTNGETRSLLL